MMQWTREGILPPLEEFNEEFCQPINEGTSVAFSLCPEPGNQPPSRHPLLAPSPPSLLPFLPRSQLFPPSRLTSLLPCCPPPHCRTQLNGWLRRAIQQRCSEAQLHA